VETNSHEIKNSTQLPRNKKFNPKSQHPIHTTPTLSVFPKFDLYPILCYNIYIEDTTTCGLGVIKYTQKELKTYNAHKPFKT
jgi:hypothetical protein